MKEYNIKNVTGEEKSELLKFIHDYEDDFVENIDELVQKCVFPNLAVAIASHCLRLVKLINGITFNDNLERIYKLIFIGSSPEETVAKSEMEKNYILQHLFTTLGNRVSLDEFLTVFKENYYLKREKLIL